MLKPYLKNYYILQISSVASKLSKIFSASLPKPPFYRVAKVILPIIMTKTFCKILTSFIVLFLRAFRFFFEAGCKYTDRFRTNKIDLQLIINFSIVFLNQCAKSGAVFQLRGAKIRVSGFLTNLFYTKTFVNSTNPMIVIVSRGK
jgi:hypothetical protein